MENNSGFVTNRDAEAWKPATIDIMSPNSYSLSMLNKYLFLPLDVNTIPTLPILCYEPTSTDQPPESASDEITPEWSQSPVSDSNTRVINTGFNPDSVLNSRFQFAPGSQPDVLHEQTERHRKWVTTQGEWADSIETLETKVRFQETYMLTF